MKTRLLLPLIGLMLPVMAYANALTGDVQRQPLNIQAIVMFLLFVGGTLYITY